jgi:hypothetical protein
MEKTMRANVEELEAHLMFTMMDIRDLIKHIGYDGFLQAIGIVLNASNEAREFTEQEKAFMQELLNNWKH